MVVVLAAVIAVAAVVLATAFAFLLSLKFEEPFASLANAAASGRYQIFHTFDQLLASSSAVGSSREMCHPCQ